MARKKRTVEECYNSPFSTTLRALMESNGTTQADLSRVVGKTPQTISQYVNGISEPGYSTLVEIANYFGVSTDYLLGISSAPLPGEELRIVRDYTGLSDQAIAVLHSSRDLFFEEFGSVGNTMVSLMIGHSREEYTDLTSRLVDAVSVPVLLENGLPNKDMKEIKSLQAWHTFSKLVDTIWHDKHNEKEEIASLMNAMEVRNGNDQAD